MILTFPRLGFFMGEVKKMGHLPELSQELNRAASVKALRCVPEM